MFLPLSRLNATIDAGCQLDDAVESGGKFVRNQFVLKGDIQCPFYHKLIWFLGVLMKCL